jgi:hypothetical protein
MLVIKSQDATFVGMFDTVTRKDVVNDNVDDDDVMDVLQQKRTTLHVIVVANHHHPDPTESSGHMTLQQLLKWTQSIRRVRYASVADPNSLHRSTSSLLSAVPQLPAVPPPLRSLVPIHTSMIDAAAAVMEQHHRYNPFHRNESNMTNTATTTTTVADNPNTDDDMTLTVQEATVATTTPQSGSHSHEMKNNTMLQLPYIWTVLLNDDVDDLNLVHQLWASTTTKSMNGDEITVNAATSTTSEDTDTKFSSNSINNNNNNNHHWKDAQRLLMIQYGIRLAQRRIFHTLPRPKEHNESAETIEHIHDQDSTTTTLGTTDEEFQPMISWGLQRLIALRLLVLPLLYPSSIISSQLPSSSFDQYSDEFVTAIFDAVFAYDDEVDDPQDSSTTTTTKRVIQTVGHSSIRNNESLASTFHQWLKSCINVVLKSTIPSNPNYIVSYKTTCRLLRQLTHFVAMIFPHTKATATTNDNYTIMLQMSSCIWSAMTTMVQSAMTILRTATTRFSQDDATHILIPIATTKSTTVSTSSSTPIQISNLLLPLTSDVLPILSAAILEHCCRKGIEYNNTIETNMKLFQWVSKLWNMIWESYNSDTSMNHVPKTNVGNDTVVLEQYDSLQASITSMTCVITSLLCALLPSMVQIPHPILTKYLKIAIMPIYHPPLWSLIQQCLRLGLMYHVDSRGRRRSTIRDSNCSSNSDAGRTKNASNRSYCSSIDIIHMHQLHRRRGLYLLRILIEQWDCSSNVASDTEMLATTSKVQVDDPSGTEAQSQHNVRTTNENHVIGMWRKYVSCFEMVEMESEQHLIDQVWGTVTELFEHIVSPQTSTATIPGPQTFDNGTIDTSSGTTTASVQIPILTWDWMKLLLGRVLIFQDSPVLRKLCLFRLLKGQAGIRINADEEKSHQFVSTKSSKRKAKESSNTKPEHHFMGAPLTVISVDFLYAVIICSFDTLMSSVGTNMQATAAVLSNESGPSSGMNNQVAVSEDMIPLLCNFVSVYLKQVLKETVMLSSQKSTADALDQLREFFHRLWSVDIVDGVHHKITVNIFQAVEETLRQSKGEKNTRIPLCDDMLRCIAKSFQLAFSDGAVVPAYKDSLLKSLAIMLKHSIGSGHHTPLAVLDILALYPVRMLNLQPVDGDEIPTTMTVDSVALSLCTWLNNGVVFVSRTGANFGAIVATAFVDGMLQSESLSQTSDWNPKSGCSTREYDLAKAITIYCILSNMDENQSTAGELLWPAIHKGLSHASTVTLGGTWNKADRVSRALLLLDFGLCFRVLSGLGNGDLVLDKRSQNMLPPPPSIDLLLSTGVNFLLYHVKNIIIIKIDVLEVVEKEISSQPSRSSDARLLSSTFAKLVEQLTSITNGFPSSMTVSEIINDTLNQSLSAVCGKEKRMSSNNETLDIALIFAALACKGEIDTPKALHLASIILHSEFDKRSKTAGSVQALRSIHQFSKWGALSFILSNVRSDLGSGKDIPDIQPFLDEFFQHAITSVESTPSTALVPLFKSVVTAANIILLSCKTHDCTQLAKVIRSLFDLVDACDNNVDAVCMTYQLCNLIFQPTLMIEEYRRSQAEPDADIPIRDAFRRIVKSCGTQRPHISRIVISRICASWLQTKEIGISAIPYRDDIVKLLVHKEEIIPVTSSFAHDIIPAEEMEMEMVNNGNETNVSRGFLLVFFSKLPGIDKQLPSCVQTDLIHYVILKLLRLVARAPLAGSGLVMYGVSAS